MGIATARLEFRISPDHKARIYRAAELSGESVTSFARNAAEEKAEQVIRDHETVSVVPATFFDDLLAALDAPARPHSGVIEAVQLHRQLVNHE